jgi:hypothetical protein
MSVRIKATVMLPEMFGNVVDMPTPEILIIENKNGFFTVHADEVVEYFYS